MTQGQAFNENYSRSWVAKGSINRNTRSTIKKIQVSDFKGLSHGEMDLESKNFLCGANSAGKSSLIQALLLLVQSQANRKIGRRIELNGELVQLGLWKDAVKEGKDLIRYRIEIVEHHLKSGILPEERTNENIIVDLEIGAAASSANQGNEGFLQVYGIEIYEGSELILSAKKKVPYRPTAEKMRDEGIATDSLLKVESAPGSVDDTVRIWLQVSGFEISQVIVQSAGLQISKIYQWIKKASRKNSAGMIDFLEFSSSDRITKVGRSPAEGDEAAPRDSIVRAVKNSIANKPFLYYSIDEGIPVTIGSEGFEDFVTTFRIGTRISNALSSYNTALRSFAGALKYLGPLRQEPTVSSNAFGVQRSALTPVGVKGELAAKVFAEIGNRKTHSVDPDLIGETAKDKFRPHPLYKYRPTANSLEFSVSKWINYLGVAREVNTASYGKQGQGFKLDVPNGSRDLTAVGVGASQLLPVVVMVLSASKDDIIVLEQPELHLHPSVQARMADFFLYARPDLSFIIETHSEYLITRSRLRSIEDHGEFPTCGIYFSEWRGTGYDVFPVGQEEDGDISDWPEGFFDTLEADLLSLYKAKAGR